MQVKGKLFEAIWKHADIKRITFVYTVTFDSRWIINAVKECFNTVPFLSQRILPFLY